MFYILCFFFCSIPSRSFSLVTKIRTWCEGIFSLKFGHQLVCLGATASEDEETMVSVASSLRTVAWRQDNVFRSFCTEEIHREARTLPSVAGAVKCPAAVSNHMVRIVLCLGNSDALCWSHARGGRRCGTMFTSAGKAGTARRPSASVGAICWGESQGFSSSPFGSSYFKLRDPTYDPLDTSAWR